MRGEVRAVTEEQKVKVFRSLIKETRITGSGVEFEMYVQPTQNVWWKYRQKTQKRTSSNDRVRTMRFAIFQPPRPDNRVYTTGQVANVLGISPNLLRWRIKMGKYPDAPRGNGERRLFTNEHVERLRAIP
jgi:MerR HTH family regulatory protein